MHLEAEENGDEVEEFVELRRTTNTKLVRGIINTSEAMYTMYTVYLLQLSDFIAEKEYTHDLNSVFLC